jgi:serine/threonine-protein phosphatase PP1 catalytic subunit
LVWHLLTVFV